MLLVHVCCHVSALTAQSGCCFFFWPILPFWQKVSVAKETELLLQGHDPPPPDMREDCLYMSVWHVSSVRHTLWHNVMCGFVPSSANNPPKKKENPKQTNKHRNYRRLFQAAAFNHQKQISVSVEAKSGIPLLPATLLPDTHPSSPPVPASPASSLTPTTYKSWHNTQRWWTSQAQTTICSA